MTFEGILQILLFLIVLMLLVKPLGVYLTKVYAGEKTFLSFIFKPLERFIYAICRVEAEREMNWKQYGAAMLIFSLVSTIVLYFMQRWQFYLPLNPRTLQELRRISRLTRRFRL